MLPVASDGAELLISLLTSWMQMFGALSVIILFAGAGLAYASRLSRSQRKLFERLGGMLFITGLVLLGFAFPLSY
jgi:hypothetical protein